MSIGASDWIAEIAYGTKTLMRGETIGARIKEARERLGISQAKLADAAGVTQPTVWEWENGVSSPQRSRVTTIANALKTTPDYLERGGTRSGGTFEELTQKVPIIGSVQAGAWMEAYQLPEGEWSYMTLPTDTRFPGISLVGFRNVGSSMNRKFADGAILVCVRYLDIEQEPQAGHYVIVEREDRSGRVEATCKLLKLDEHGKPWLWPDSTDPRYQQPISLKGDRDTSEIRVIGRVLRVVTDL